MEDHQAQQHQHACRGRRGEVSRAVGPPAGPGRLHSPDRMKQMDAGFRKNRISLLSDIVMHMAPITIRKRLNMASMAVAMFRSAGGSSQVKLFVSSGRKGMDTDLFP